VLESDGERVLLGDHRAERDRPALRAEHSQQGMRCAPPKVLHVVLVDDRFEVDPTAVGQRLEQRFDLCCVVPFELHQPAGDCHPLDLVVRTVVRTVVRIVVRISCR
jgi:hypothetical protein